MSYIIVKYAEDNYPNGVAPIEASIFGTYSARNVEVNRDIYPNIEEANIDLKKLIDFNPSVYYGVVKLEV